MCELYEYMDGLVQDYSNTIANALELLQPSTKPSVWTTYLVLTYPTVVKAHDDKASPGTGLTSVEHNVW